MKSRPRLLKPDFSLERNFCSKGYVLGLDEVGRGCIAGPVVAAGVIWPVEFIQNVNAQELPEFLDQIDDSKRIRETKREALAEQIREAAVFCETFSVSAAEVDKINILRAALSAFREIYRSAEKKFGPLACALIDGNQKIPGIEGTQLAVVSGDSRSKSIAAASIVAKVSRDALMKNLDSVHPEYGFGQHKGYGTKVHWEALEQHGPLPIHRQTFLGRLHKRNQGRGSEALAESFLKDQGWELYHRNWKSPIGEIDLIVGRGDSIRFVEVRSQAEQRADLAFPKIKQDKFKRVVESYLAFRGGSGTQTVHYDLMLVADQQVNPLWDVFQW